MYSLHSACLGSSYRTYYCHIEGCGLLADTCCLAWDRKHRTDERVAGAVSVVGDDELLGSGRKLDRNTFRGDDGCACCSDDTLIRCLGVGFKVSAQG